jgi:hypothetical protein
MENENEPVETEDMAEEESSVIEKNHGFSSHSSGTWNQDEMISNAEKDSNAQLPPKTRTTEGKA